jgi:predicted ester cyclase
MFARAPRLQASSVERDEIRRLLDRWLNEAVVAGNVAIFDQLLSSDVLDLGAANARGSAPFKQRALAVHSAFSELSASLDELLVDGERIAWRWSVEGTHTGTFGGVAPTGRRVTLRGANFQRLAGGRIVEHWTLADTFGLLQELCSLIPG